MKSLIFISILILLSINNSFSEENCTNYKKLSKEYLKCIGGKIKEKSSNVGIDSDNIKEKKYLVDWFKKKK
tara:strand:- start:275 stop:487 length:213 start_codon:yes stop_codon:yes gene_type:complete